MSRLRAACAVALGLVAAGCAAQAPFAGRGPLGAPAAATVEARGVEVERVVSPGGIEAWLVSDSTVPIIVLEATFKGGSALDPPGKTGAASMLAAMLTEGAGSLEAEAFKVRLEELNMSLGFSAGWDGLAMGLSTLAENRDAAFGLARLALAEPRFDAAPLERLRRQTEIGLRQRETNPGFLANRALDAALIPGHPYARRMEAADLAAIDRAAIIERRAALMTRDRLLITVAGDIDAATLGPLLDATFGHLPVRSSATAVVPVASPVEAAREIVVPLPQPQSLVLFAAPGIQEDHPDFIPLTVANYIIGGGGFRSRLMQQVREARGLVYGVGTGPRVYEAAAFVTGSAQTENEDVAQAIEVIRQEMAGFAATGATEAEVQGAIQYLTGSFPLDLDSNAKIADRLHSYQVDGRDIDYVNRRNQLIASVTKADVDRVARQYFDPKSFTFVVVGQPVGFGGG